MCIGTRAETPTVQTQTRQIKAKVFQNINGRLLYPSLMMTDNVCKIYAKTIDRPLTASLVFLNFGKSHWVSPSVQQIIDLLLLLTLAE